MGTCSAIIQQGARKGLSCMFPSEDDGYCERHKRNKVYDDGIKEGKNWCRFFFRGCNNILESDNVSTSCTSCRNKTKLDKVKCGNQICNNYIKEGKYCLKHERDIYRDEEKEKNIKYCDIARGCFNIVKDTIKCPDCLEKTRITDNARYSTRKELNMALIKHTNTTQRICNLCGKDYEKYLTSKGQESFICQVCQEKQKNQDSKRKDRNRDYSTEKIKNIKTYYKEYIKNANKRDLDILITFDVFCELVNYPCYYCDYFKEGSIIGIDRINNDIGYIKENIVPCCENCNYMKSFYHPLFFIQKCKIIAGDLIPDKSFYDKWDTYYSRATHTSYNIYKEYVTNNRGIEFELTEKDWDFMVRKQCYLCNYSQVTGIGIDRVDNNIRKYTLSNCRPCCGSCNIMKHEQILEEFINKCRYISNKWIDTKVFDNVPITKNPYKKQQEKVKEKQKKTLKRWKGLSLYYAIISNETGDFENMNKDTLKENELIELSIQIKLLDKDNAIQKLSTFLNTLNVRRKRLK